MIERRGWADLFIYDETSPSYLRNRVSRGAAKKDDISGWQREDGYWLVGVDGRNVLTHRIIYEIFNGTIESGFEIDHKDGNPSNNSKENLRSIPKSVNQRNMKGDKRNSSGITGVSKVRVSRPKGIYEYWSTTWVNETGRKCVKYFPVSEFGDDKAKRLAEEFRQKMIERLNNLGLGYSERHGDTID